MSFGGVKEVSQLQTYDQYLAKIKKAQAAAPAAAPAPTAAAPTSTPAFVPPAASASAPPVASGPAGSKVVEPEPDSMAGLQAAAGGGGGDFGGGAGDNISGPSRFRQGIGQRIPPQMSMALAGLRQAY